MKHHRTFFRSFLAFILVLASILSLGANAFATVEPTPDGQTTEGTISREEADEVIENSDVVLDLREDDPLEWDIPELDLTEPDTTERDRIEALANEILYGTKASSTEEEKPATRAANYTDYIFMSFNVGDKSRNFNWQLSSSRNADTNAYATTRDLLYFAADYQGLLAAWLKGDGPDVRMPLDLTDSGKTRLNSYKIKSTDMAQVRIEKITDGATDFPGTGTGTSTLYFNTSDTASNSWEKVATASIPLTQSDKLVTFSSLNSTYHGDTLYGVAFEPLTKNGIVGTAGTNAEKGYRVYIDFIYIGPAQYKPLLVEYYDVGGAKFKNSDGTDLGQMHWKGYVGYDQKAFDFHYNHGKKNSATSVWGWEIYQKDGSGTWVNTNQFTLNPAGFTCQKDTRFYLKNVTIPSTKVSSTQSQSADATDPDKYVVTAEAVDSVDLTAGTTGSPLDITIVLDRTANMGSIYSAKEATSASALTTVLNGLDKTKWEGYYRCSAWVPNWNREKDTWSTTNEGGYIYYAPLRYYRNKWQAQILTGCNCNKDTYRSYGREYGIYTWLSLKPCKHVKWMDVADARTAFYDNRKAQNSSFTTEFKIGISRLGRVQYQLKRVLETLYNSSSNLALGAYHRVSVLSYGDSVYVPGYPFEYDPGKYLVDKDDDNNNIDLGVSITSRYVSYSNYEAILETICHPYVLGRNNRIDVAMQALSGDKSAIEKGYCTANNISAKNFLTASNYLPNDASREGICFVVSYYPALKTDGTDTFDFTYANAAIAAAYKVKVSKSTTVYSICLGSGLGTTAQAYNRSFHAGTTATGDTNYNGLCANLFRMISSNYKDSVATNLPTKDEASSDTNLTKAIGALTTGHYIPDMTDSYTDTLVSKFSGKWASTKPTMKATATGGSGSLWLHEEFQREWKLDPDRDVVIYALPHTGNNSYGTPVEIGRHKTSDLTTSPISGNGYKLYVTQKANGRGFEISLQWLDAKKAYLRNTDFYTVTAATGSTMQKGYKVRMEIPLAVNRENTLGGNNIPLNDGTNSGFYTTASGDAAKGTKISTYAKLNANVPFPGGSEAFAEYGFYDYFMTMEEYMALHGTSAKRVESSAVADVYGNLMTVNENMQLVNASNESRMGYVSFEFHLKSEDDTLVYHKKADVNATSFSENVDKRTELSALLEKDTSFTGTTKVTYASHNTDSFGRAPYDDVNLTGNATLYVPKFAVVDFDAQASVDLQKEAEIIDLTAENTGKNGAFTVTGTGTSAEGKVDYNFRETYTDSSEQKSMLESIETIPYTVKAKNPTKSGQTVMNREVYILPGNVISYDDTLFGFWEDGALDTTATAPTAGKWVRVGTYGNDDQLPKNAQVHGYDAAFATTGDYHGASTVARVTKSAPDAPPIVFEVFGTGFELLSRTAPDSGAVVVEIFKAKADGTYGAVADTGYLVDTYLASKTLYQIPIVQFLSGDTTPAKYKVHVIPVYDMIFDHGKKGFTPVTEEQARAVAGFDETVDFTFIPSPSVAPATRAAFEPAGAYNVYVDGCRVYNTLAEDAQGIRNFVYSLAGEQDANILNINDQIVDVTTKVDWTNSTEVSGILFIEAPKMTNSDVEGDTGSDETITTSGHGYCLGMDGSLYEEQDATDNNKFYVRTPDLKYILHGKYGTRIYYRVTPKKRAMFFCTDSNNAEVRLTDAEVREYVGSDGEIVYYSAAYKAIGPANEVYLSSGQGVAFMVNSHNAKVFMSMKTVDGKDVTVQAYKGSGFEPIPLLESYCSDTEMYFDLTDYVVDGMVMIKNAGDGILSLCNLKTASADGALQPMINTYMVPKALRAFNHEAELPVVDESVQIRHSLNLQSDISVNLMVPVSVLEGYDRYVMECTVAGKTFLPEAVVKGDYVYFVVDGIMATQMNENIHSVLHLIKGDETFTSVEDDYSVACYAYSVLNKDAADNIKTLCANLLRYGSLAQLYKGYETDAPADEEMTEVHKSYLTDMETVVFGNNNRLLGDVAEPAVTWFGKSMILDSKVTVVYVLNTNGYEGSLEDLSLRVTYEAIDGTTTELELEDLQVYNEAAGLYSFKLDTLLAAELRAVVSAAVYSGETQVSETLCYSADTYGNGKTGTLAELCKALFAYSDSARAFFAN